MPRIRTNAHLNSALLRFGVRLTHIQENEK